MRLALAALLLATPAAAQLAVSPSGPYTDVAAAVRAARPGDRIVVRAGVYRTQDVVIDKRVELAGEPGAVLDAGGEHEALVVRADGVVVRGLTFRNVTTSFISDRAALRFDGVTGCVAEDNRFEGTFFGIYLARSRDCRVTRNHLRGSFKDEANSGNAIHLWATTHTVVAGNDVSGHRDGIYLEFARHAEVADNRSHDNFRYGLHYMFSDSCAYERNHFTGNGAGVAVMYTKFVRMVENEFLDNWGAVSYGLLLKDINDSQVERNRFVGNTTGLHLEGSNRVVVAGNVFERNGWALRLLGNSESGRIERNRFTANTFDMATNSASTAAVVAENEWDEYRGYDLDGDGYGDVPHRPVRLFSILVQDNEPALILLRSVFVSLLDVAERVLPVLVPKGLVDERPRVRRGAA
ncbi:MAG: nitrous oxide reductase family maturation protein NosD [Gemmatimonadales bacterium]|jgi:nitrous oxidase accessory protein|nr:nitrous oxide reductase family maturation protein NosD [Gemmatimonadales bacterium]